MMTASANNRTAGGMTAAASIDNTNAGNQTAANKDQATLTITFSDKSSSSVSASYVSQTSNEVTYKEFTS
jgi:hypothetical protein